VPEDNWFDNTPAMLHLWEQGQKAVGIVAEVILGDAQRHAPVLEGTLRGSGVVMGENNTVPEKGVPAVIERTIAFTVEYAAIQEETDEYEHPMGGEAHYLGNALKAHAGELTVALDKIGLK
jgi:hypothetical protein